MTSVSQQCFLVHSFDSEFIFSHNKKLKNTTNHLKHFSFWQGKTEKQLFWLD